MRCLAGRYRFGWVANAAGPLLSTGPRARLRPLAPHPVLGLLVLQGRLPRWASWLLTRGPLATRHLGRPAAPRLGRPLRLLDCRSCAPPGPAGAARHRLGGLEPAGLPSCWATACLWAELAALVLS